jgi:hypothetical protein
MDRKDIQLWRGKIDSALGIQSKRHQEWRDTIDLYNCNYFNRIYGGFDPERIDVHFTNWYIDNLIPLVYFRDPFIFVKPRVESRSEFADTCEEAVNVMWRRLGLKYQFQKVIQSAFMTPPGWIKLGYTAKIGQDVGKSEEHKEKGIIEKIKNTILGKEDKKNLSPEEQGVLDQNISEESVFASWVPSWNILMPPGYHAINNMPWLCEYEDVPVIDFKMNPMYKNKDSVSSTREISAKDSGRKLIQNVPYNSTTGSGSSKDEYQLIRLYHVWDRRSQSRFTFSDNDIHFEGKWPYHMDGFPFKYLSFSESIPTNEESNVYPPNCITPILPQIIEKSQSRTMMVKYRKRAAAAILIQKGLLTEEEIDNLSENEMMQIIQVGNTAGVVPLLIPPMAPDVYNIDALIDADLQMGTNMGQMMFAAQKGTRTATQAQIGQSGLQLKASSRVDKVEDFTTCVATGLIQLMWQFMDRDQIKKLIGKDVNENMWPNLPDDPEERKSVIREELNIKIDAGSTAPPKDETVDRKQILDLASIVSSIAPERINKGEFVKQLLKKFKFTKELDKIVISGDEEEKTAAAQENQFMMQGGQQVVSPNENHEIHIQTHQMLAGQPIVDEHILMHGQMMGMKTGGQIPMLNSPQQSMGGQSGVGNEPQEGDRRLPMQSTNPELNRQSANPTSAGIMQSTQNPGAGVTNKAM